MVGSKWNISSIYLQIRGSEVLGHPRKYVGFCLDTFFLHGILPFISHFRRWDSDLYKNLRTETNLNRKIDMNPNKTDCGGQLQFPAWGGLWAPFSTDVRERYHCNKEHPKTDWVNFRKECRKWKLNYMISIVKCVVGWKNQKLSAISRYLSSVFIRNMTLP